MASSSSILVFGQDQQLLETRQWILERMGYRVWTTTEISSIADVIAYHRIDLLILCHSLSTDECARAIALAHSESPSTKTLILTVHTCNCPIELVSEVLDAREGPTKFVAGVARLIPYGSNAHSHLY